MTFGHVLRHRDCRSTFHLPVLDRVDEMIIRFDADAADLARLGVVFTGQGIGEIERHAAVAEEHAFGA